MWSEDLGLSFVPDVTLSNFMDIRKATHIAIESEANSRDISFSAMGLWSDKVVFLPPSAGPRLLVQLSDSNRQCDLEFSSFFFKAATKRSLEKLILQFFFLTVHKKREKADSELGMNFLWFCFVSEICGDHYQWVRKWMNGTDGEKKVKSSCPFCVLRSSELCTSTTDEKM